MRQMRVGAGDVEPGGTDAVPATDSPIPSGIGSLDESLGAVEHREFQPVLQAAEADTSSSSTAELVRYDVPEGRVGLLDEISLQCDSNGRIVVSVQGSDPVSFGNDVQFSAPYNGAYLYPGQRVRVLHRLDGTGTATNRAAITVREV